MSKGKEERRKVLTYIDTALLISEKGGSFNLDDFIEDTTNPFDFLLSIIQKYATKEQLLDWLVNMMTVTLPIIEVGVKGVLLSHLKGMIDCNIDPRIPNWLRYSTTQETNGVFIPIRDIDYKGILGESPLSVRGQNYYYGAKTKYEVNGHIFNTYLDARQFVIDNKLYFDSIIDKSEVKTVYELARANDFNAFLWFVIHKGKFNDALKPSDDMGNILTMSSLTDNKGIDGGFKYGVGSSVIDGQNVVMCYNFQTTPSQGGKDTLRGYDNTSALLDEIQEKISEQECISHWYHVSNDKGSVNWYANKSSYYNFLKPTSQRITRDYNKDYPICNLKYYNEINTNEFNLPVNREYLKLTILPKPYIHKGIVRVLFNAKGEPDRNGNFTIGDVGDVNVYDDLTYELKSQEYLAQKLIPCYRGQTVYEFNYDYVMSMKLFDTEVVSKQILEIALNLQPSYSLGATVSKTETMYQMRISEIVKNIIEATAYETTDCFYTFNNEKYDKLGVDAELKRSQGYSFNDSEKQMAIINADEVYKILNEFDDNATLEENKDVFTRAFTKAIAQITNEVLPEDKYSVDVNLIISMIKALTNTIVETLLSPKLVLLFETNRQLLGERNELFSIEDFIKSIEGLLVGIISEIRDMILQELLNWVLKLIKELISKVKIEIELEKYKNYATLMVLLLKACTFKTKHRQNLDSQLDNVDYADINPIEQPKIEEC